MNMGKNLHLIFVYDKTAQQIPLSKEEEEDIFPAMTPTQRFFHFVILFASMLFPTGFHSE